VQDQQSIEILLGLRADVFLIVVAVQVLANGEEVKLQRNALSVVEYGPEDVQVRRLRISVSRLLLHAYANRWSASCLQDDSSEEMTEAREPQIGERSCSSKSPVMA
jgi:hypothetical protein